MKVDEEADTSWCSYHEPSIKNPIGVLALQGAFHAHQKICASLGIKTQQVRNKKDLLGCGGLILPGGESTTMLHLLMRDKELWHEIQDFKEQGRPLWGVCAGAILMAHEVCHPTQESLHLMDVTLSRNGYGRQKESFHDTLLPGPDFSLYQEQFTLPMTGIFIRAPKITAYTKESRILFTYEKDPVCVIEDEKRLLTTFHPELSLSTDFHAFFIGLCYKDA